MLYGDSADEGFVRGRVFAHAGLGIRFEVPSGTRIDNQPKAIMITGPGDAATRFDAVVLAKFTSLPSYLRSGWINGLKPETIQTQTSAAGLETATADAETDGWRFRIQVVRNGAQAYRFITAAPVTTPQVDTISQAITSTFRLMNDSEKAALAPLHIRVVNTGANDTLGSLVDQMRGSDESLRLFLILNGLKAGETPEPGARLKIVDDA
jgi:predicted Zn-dependent protease